METGKRRPKRNTDEKTALRGKRSAQDGKKNQKPKNTSADLHPRRTKNLSDNKFHRRNKPAAEDSSEENQHTRAAANGSAEQEESLRSGCAPNQNGERHTAQIRFKNYFFIEIQQVYNRFTEVTVLPPSFNY
jgi:hypothetical protein